MVYGDRRPYPVALITLDPEIAVDPDAAPELIAGVVEAVNARYAGPSQIKRFAILDRDLSVESGELTPSMKVKRQVVGANHADVLESLYAR